MNCKACGSWIIDTLANWVPGACHNCGTSPPFDLPAAEAPAAAAVDAPAAAALTAPSDPPSVDTTADAAPAAEVSESVSPAESAKE